MIVDKGKQTVTQNEQRLNTNEYNLINHIDDFKKEMLNSICDFMILTSENLNRLKSQYSIPLVDLISVLEFNQDDINFPNEEAKAIGTYLKSKGYTKQNAEFIVKVIMNCFE